MQRFTLFFLALGMGFLTAIPVGGSQIEAAKRAICGHRMSAYMVVLGSVSSDIGYGIIALFGIAPFLEIPTVTGIFNAVGAVVLWVLSWLTIRESRKPHEFRLECAALKSKRRAYVTGFSLAVANPPMILTWLWGMTLARHIVGADRFTAGLKVLFIAGGAVGLGGYLGALSTVMFRLKHFIPMKAFGRVYKWLGIVLFLLSFFFVYNALRIFLGGC